ncbi:DEAD/DEAH box helicase [Bacillus sp. 41-22]|uniref:DEAD/DEAH box helicase n=1 Tax=Bacillus sp. 41-22 TaxID=2876713 RepID=UPI0021F203BE|nr:DEAD/DEAH box helicase [Bacillus sp. 41-22]UYO21137.1 DEAD/DEAH box helicase [Bacillus sp. 41-22]
MQKNVLTINLNKDLIFLDANQYPEISKGLFVSMFKSAGFKLDRKTGVYTGDFNFIKKPSLIKLRDRLNQRGYEVCDVDGVFTCAENATKSIEDDKKRIDIGREIKKNPTITQIKIPYFTRQLKDFQENVVKHTIAVKHGANFSCPGSGKTTMIYATYAHWKYVEKEVDKILVVCPINAFEAWETEYKGCFGVTPYVFRLNGSNRHNGYRQSEGIELFTINHSTLSNDVDKVIGLLKRHKFMVVLDESHYVKNFSEEATWASSVLKISEYAKIRMISSGTPAPNNEKDFWSQFTFLLGGEHILGNRKRYSEELHNDGSKREMMAIINALSHRVTKDDLGLPPFSIQTIKVEMSPIQKKIYDMVTGDISEEILAMSNTDSQLYLSWRKAKMTRLRQISSNPSLLRGSLVELSYKDMSNSDNFLTDLIQNYNENEMSGKIKKTVEITLDTLRKRRRVLIWTEFVDNIIYLEKFFSSYGIKTFKVYGEIPKESTDDVGDEMTREGQIAAFKETEASVLIANPQTMAEAVSLHQECHVAIYLDRSFNCAHWMQSKDRIHRVGLPENIRTEYYIIENQDSIDEVIDERLNIKEEIMNQILSNDVPVATGEFNGKDFGEDDDFNAVLKHITKIKGVGII